MPPKKALTDYDKAKALWYKKLKEEGFEDIEQDENRLKTWTTAHARYGSPTSRQAKADYYLMAEHFLNNYTFERELDRAIWEYHTNGISIRDIADTLNCTGVIKTERNAVWKIVNQLETLMKNMYLKRDND